ncbi:unnamed protein product [Ilex paraguariensis]|uniref:Dirigent protein n=1 Tax=Ilex paraguariensis TaxID=185542 RepID=A0ABC8RVE8_9AQUA
MADDPLTMGPDSNSKPVGKSRGLYGFSGELEQVLIMVMNFGFTDGIYNDSSFTIATLDPIFQPSRDLSVMGGTSLFRLGYSGETCSEETLLEEDDERKVGVDLAFDRRHRGRTSLFRVLLQWRYSTAMTQLQSWLPMPTSQVIGNAQGLYVSSNKGEDLILVFYLDFGFTTGKFNGSSISIFSRDIAADPVAELAVVGGRGKFRMARGFALLKIVYWDTGSGNAVVECDVTVIHYAEQTKVATTSIV